MQLLQLFCKDAYYGQGRYFKNNNPGLTSGDENYEMKNKLVGANR